MYFVEQACVLLPYFTQLQLKAWLSLERYH